MKIRAWAVVALVLLFGLAACASDEAPAAPLSDQAPALPLSDEGSISPPPPDEDYTHPGLSDAEAAGLLSLEQVDDYPLYTMHHYAAYDYEEYEASAPIESRVLIDALDGNQETWGCSLFVTFADLDARVFGRNFDWRFSPALLLFTDPADGYASAAMVDITYLGFDGDQAENLTTKPLSDLMGLLDAPYIPFDGLNEAGLVIGMAAVPPGHVPVDPNKDTIGSLGAIRVVLDKAATVEEALELLFSYNIDFEGGPPLHYLIADAGGDAALVEYYQEEIHVIRSVTNWHQATNFITAAVDSPKGQSPRYDAMSAELEANQGVLDVAGALSLLERVAQPDTQWSVVYSANSGEVRVAMGRDYEQVYSFELEMMEG